MSECMIVRLSVPRRRVFVHICGLNVSSSCVSSMNSLLTSSTDFVKNWMMCGGLSWEVSGVHAVWRSG